MPEYLLCMMTYYIKMTQYLEQNGIREEIEDATLVALTIMIAESRPEEKEMMISVIMNYIQ